ncbi:hypothetical protein ACVBEJ_05480 [Porticoccus sp. GXU_MW_L64]
MIPQPSTPQLAAIPVNYHFVTNPPACHKPLERIQLSADRGEFGLSFSINGNDCQQQLELLPRELALYKQQLRDTAVSQIWLTGGQLHNIAPADLTCFCYLINNHLRGNTHKAIYGIEINHDHIDPETLALLHGLHFRRLKIRFDYSAELDKGGWMQRVDNTISTLDNAGFRDIICQINLANFSGPDALNRLLLSLQLYNPQQIELVGIPEDSAHAPIESQKTYLNLLKRAQQRGYQILGNQVLAAPDSRLQHLYQQRKLRFTPWGYCSDQLTGWLGLGLSAQGNTGNLYYRNCGDLNCYRTKLENGSPPLHWYGQLPEQRAGTESIVQSLLCYGEVSNDQLTRLAGDGHQHASAAIARACERLWLEPNQQQWQLTSSGRVGLRQLLRDLQQTTLKP